MVAPEVCGPSVYYLLQETFLAPKILRWRLGLGKMFAPLLQMT